MMYRLIVMTGPQTGQRITIETEPMTMGSGDDCQIHMQDDEVARRHAVIEHNEKGLFIRDLGSMNRILVNNREIREGKLKHGDMIELGRTRYLVQASVRAEVDGDAPVEEAPKPRRTPAWMIAFRLAVVFVVIAVGVFWKTRQPSTEAPLNPKEPLDPLVSQFDPNAVALPATSDVPEQVSNTVSVPQVPVVAPATSALPILAPPVPVPVTGGMDQATVDEMRGQLAGVVAALSNLTATATQKVIIVSNPPPKVVTQIVETVSEDRPTAEEVIHQRIEDLMAQAREVSAGGEWVKADDLLRSITSLDPDYIPAYAERAFLYERRAMPDKAVEQWSEIIRKGEGVAMYAKAQQEYNRLTQQMNSATAKNAQRIKIASVEQNKFQRNDEFDEQRAVNIVLKTENGESVESAGVRVEVSFFDKDAKSGAIVPTQAMVPTAPLKVEGPWGAGEQKQVIATYTIPKGFRQKQAASGRNETYYGFVVRTYYKGLLQDTTAMPMSLSGYATGRTGRAK